MEQLQPLFSLKENRDRLKDEYSKYKSNPESYKQNAKDIASQISSKAGETYNEVKQDPKGYASKVKQDPKGFINEQKGRFKMLVKMKKSILKKRDLLMKVLLIRQTTYAL